MDILVESIEYYYDEDFSVPFDIGISEENNNTNINIDYRNCENILKYLDITDDEENDADEYDTEDFERIILSPDIFNQLKSNNHPNPYQHNRSIKFINLRHSFDNDCKRIDSTTHSAVRMSCSSSSSPISSSSMATNNIDKCNRLCVDNQNVSFNDSIYSLKKRVPLFNVNNKNILVNYHLHFAPQDSLINSSFITSHCCPNSDIFQTNLNKNSPQKSTTNLIDDSGKCSGTTIDSILHQINEQQRQKTNLLQRLNNSSNNNRSSLKPDSILWRQLKFLMNYFYAGWRLMNMFKQFRKKQQTKCRLQPSSTDEIVFYRLNNRTNQKRRQSYSCSVLEVFNAIKDVERRLDDIPCKKRLSTNECPQQQRQSIRNKSIQNFSCQFPPKHRSPQLLQLHQLPPNGKDYGGGGTPQRATNQVFDYPGIGRLSMPKQTRLSSSAFLTTNIHSHLSFLQSSLSSHHSDITCNRPCGSDSGSAVRCNAARCNTRTQNQSPLLSMSPSPSTQPSSSLLPHGCVHSQLVDCQRNGDAHNNLKPCLRKEDESDESKEVVCRPKSAKLMAENFKRKSVSFDCPGVSSENFIQELKEIPKKWGLLGSQSRLIGDMMAVFECGRRDSLAGASPVSDNFSGNDDATRFRGMVNDVLRAVKLISDRLSVVASNGAEKVCPVEMNNSFQSQLAVLCEMVSNGDGLESPLATAIDNLIALMSDGLVVTSFSNKKVRISASSANKAAMRLWLLVEETCRNPGNQNTSRKAELAQLLREVRQIITNISSTKDHQLRLRAFIASALKSGLLHVWIRSVVANDTALQRFYCPEAFLRQARSGQSDALAALTVSLKALISVQSASPTGNSTNNSTGNPSAPLVTRPVLPPPVRISRRFFSSPSSELSTKPSANNHSQQKPLYSEENTESESYADESRSSQSECPPNRDVSNNNNNNNIFSRATHPRTVKKSNSSQLHSPAAAAAAVVAADSPRHLMSRNPVKSLTNQNFAVNSSPAAISIKTVRNQPIASRIKPAKPDKS